MPAQAASPPTQGIPPRVPLTRVAVPFVVSLVCAAACGGQTLGDDARQYLSTLANTHLSSGAVLLARGDTVVFETGFGLADIDRGVANSAETRFRIGSITKSMTWAVISRLADTGRLTLDAPVASLIDVDLPRGLTVRHLLTHEGGVADWSTFDDADVYRQQATPLQELATWIAARPLVFEPGSDRSYSNSGYILLARVIEVTSGRPYPDFLRAALFDPLEMPMTSHVSDAELEGLAHGYVPGNVPTPVVDARPDDPSILTGSGSVASTVGDLFTWSRSPQGRGFPWDRGIRNGRPVTFMGGFVPGYAAWVEHYENEDLTIVVLSNLNNGAMQRVVPDLGALLLGQGARPPGPFEDREASETQVQALSGSWQCNDGPSFTIRPRGERLEMLWAHREPGQPLWIHSDAAVFYPQDFAVLTIGDGGTEGALEYAPVTGDPMTCSRGP